MNEQHSNPVSQQQNQSKIKPTKIKQKKNNQGKDKTLMRLQQPIYQLKKKDQGDAEYVIRKLMDRKQIKPKIGALQRSPLFTQLQAILPAIKKANQQLKNRTIPQSEKLDAKLEQVQDSSSSSSSDDDNDNQGQNKMSIQKKSEQMIDQAQQEKQSPHTNEVELNFLRYEFSENLQSIQVKQQPQNEEEEEKKTTKKGNKKLIEEL